MFKAGPNKLDSPDPFSNLKKKKNPDPTTNWMLIQPLDITESKIFAISLFHYNFGKKTNVY